MTDLTVCKQIKINRSDTYLDYYDENLVDVSKKTSE